MTEQKINIELHSVLRDLVRNIWVILCAAVIGVLGSYVINHIVYKPVYTSSASLIVNSAAGKSNAVATLTQSSEIANIYSEVFIQPTMKQKVCEYLGTSSFDGNINARVNKGTNIMELSVTAHNPEEAYKELRAILKVYPEITSTLYSNGVVTVLKAASVPKRPSNSLTTVNMIKIAAISMAIGILLIVFASSFRDTVKSEKNFKEKIDADLFGIIPHEKKQLKPMEILKGKKKALLIFENAFTSLKFSENFNNISAKLEYAKRLKGEKIIAVTSVAENEGKSTIASNIALSLALKGNKVVLIDLDGKKPALYKIFEQEPDENSEFGAMLSGEIDKRNYTFRQYKKTALFLALNTRSYKDYQRWYDDDRIKRIFNVLRKKADFIIVDTAPMSFDGSVTSATALCDTTLLVVRTDTVYAPIINDAILTIQNTGSNFSGCILNDVYEEFSLFSQMGASEAGYTGYGRYGRYGKYSKYGRYGHYGRYGKYGGYAYGRYGRYAGPMALDDADFPEESAPTIVETDPENGGGI